MNKFFINAMRKRAAAGFLGAEDAAHAYKYGMHSATGAPFYNDYARYIALPAKYRRYISNTAPMVGVRQALGRELLAKQRRLADIEADSTIPSDIRDQATAEDKVISRKIDHIDNVLERAYTRAPYTFGGVGALTDPVAVQLQYGPQAYRDLTSRVFTATDDLAFRGYQDGNPKFEATKPPSKWAAPR